MKRSLICCMLACSVLFFSACGGNTDTPTGGNTETNGNAVTESNGTQEGASTGTQGSTSEIKVATIFGGNIKDGNWNETQYNGLKSIEAMGGSIYYMENVSDTDSAEAARQYGEEGFDLVYIATNSMQDYCVAVSGDYPNTTYIQINGTVMTDNFISVSVADEEQGFMQGVIAALLTEAGKVGFVGGLEITPIINGSIGFQQGVDYINQNYGKSVEALRINTGSFTDVNQAKETAISIIESGADIITPMADDASVGIMEAAEDKGIMSIGSGVGLELSAPNSIQITVVKDIAKIYDATFSEYTNGTLSSEKPAIYGAENGVVYLTDWYRDVSPEIQEQVAEIMDKLVSGEIVISVE